MTYEDVAESYRCEVWECNFKSFEVFSHLSTQWRVGMNGPSGLDYGVIPSVMSMLGVAEDDKADIFRDIGIMESAALEEMSKKRDKK